MVVTNIMIVKVIKMTYKNIPVKPETHERLTALMKKSETYDQFINKLLEIKGLRDEIYLIMFDKDDTTDADFQIHNSIKDAKTEIKKVKSEGNNHNYVLIKGKLICRNCTLDNWGDPLDVWSMED
jgi:hypothetical protein